MLRRRTCFRSYPPSSPTRISCRCGSSRAGLAMAGTRCAPGKVAVTSSLTRSPDRGTKSMPSPPSPIEIRAEHHFRVAVFQRFTVAMIQPFLADLPVADRQPIGAKGTQIVSTLLPSNSLCCGLPLLPSSTRPSRPGRGCH